MDFLLDEDLKEFYSSLERYLNSTLPEDTLQQIALEEGKLPLTTEAVKADPLWNGLSELGCFAIPLDENHGGLEMGVSAVGGVLEVFGKRLTPVPASATLQYGCYLMNQSANERLRTRYLEKLATGDLIVSGSLELHAASPLQFDEKSKTASGTAMFVPFAEAAELLVLKAKDGSFLAIEKKAAQATLQLERLAVADLLTPYYKVRLEKAPAELLRKADENINRTIYALISSETAGAALFLLELTKNYVAERKQFGKPIGSFQAVAHKLSDMAVHVEAAQTLCRFSLKQSEKQEFLPAVAAKSFASSALTKVAESALQAHGGIGFTYEYCLHLYLRRILTLSKLGGSAAELNLELGRELLG